MIAEASAALGKLCFFFHCSRPDCHLHVNMQRKVVPQSSQPAETQQREGAVTTANALFWSWKQVQIIFFITKGLWKIWIPWNRYTDIKCKISRVVKFQIQITNMNQRGGVSGFRIQLWCWWVTSCALALLLILKQPIWFHDKYTPHPPA